MKILGVQFYQGVRLNNEVHKYIKPGQQLNASNVSNPSTITIKETDYGVLVTQGQRATLTSWNNIQGIEYELVPEEKSEPVAKKAK